MENEAAKEWKQFKEWVWSSGAALIGLLTGAVGWLWMGSVEKQLGAHDTKHESYEANFYKDGNRLATMEAELRYLRESRSDLEERIRTLCRETRKC